MKTLFIHLELLNSDCAALSYYFDNPNQRRDRAPLYLKEIEDLIHLAETEYYVFSLGDLATIGQRLYAWLDGTERYLSSAIETHKRDGLTLAIDIAAGLSHLPWEILHDRSGFLVEQRIVPIRWTPDSAPLSLEPANRALRILFMATAPTGIEPVLNFEIEEARILQATARQPLTLMVEESGCLTELGQLVASYDRAYFDVLHLTGHAQLTEQGTRFLTETEIGECYLASAQEVAQCLRFRFPKLIFLSGCRAGQSINRGVVPSMAEELLAAGAWSVLAWGRPVLDHVATDAAADLYGALSSAYELGEALALTYQTLIQKQVQDWHSLRLYVRGAMPQALVTPLRTPKREPPSLPSVATRFMDVEHRVKVATRENFVGRRRHLQACLRRLSTPETLGVLIHGMGGLGKSSLAARLCDRLPEFERIVWVGKLNEAKLVSTLSKSLNDKGLREILQDPNDALTFRLIQVFQALSTEKQFLLVFDDFETNLEPRGDQFVASVEAIQVLDAIATAIQQTYTNHRLILTCRYDFQCEPLNHFYRQPLDALQGADLRKKCDRLVSFNTQALRDEALSEQALRLADGNPRLLEWLDKVLQNPQINPVDLLKALEQEKLVELRAQVLAKELLDRIDPPLQSMLQLSLAFKVPVPKAAIAEICPEIPNLDHHIEQAIALGLLEVSPDECLRVPRILPLHHSPDPTLFAQAARFLYQIWWRDTIAETRYQEIHRLAILGQEAAIATEIANSLANTWCWECRFRDAVEICRKTIPAFQDYKVLHELARAEDKLGEIENCLEHYNQALALCPSSDQSTKSAIINNLAVRYQMDRQFDKARDLHEQSLAIKEQSENHLDIATAKHNLARNYCDQGNLVQGMRLFQESLAHIEKELSRPSLSPIRQKVAWTQKIATMVEVGWRTLIEQEKFPEALAHYQEILEISRRISNPEYEGIALMCIAEIYGRQGYLDEAIGISWQALSLFISISSVGYVVDQLEQIEEFLTKKNDRAATLAFYQQVLPLWQQLNPAKAELIQQRCNPLSDR